ncbi:MAG TPA: Fe-S protein assembly chaperone HscA [Candidatus Megaira endosymbiont of Stentor roeselii]|nr:Fe-S protein assembly chaperone HscA [Candidatus Megaera endosymbiont of Stentor roeselii]
MQIIEIEEPGKRDLQEEIVVGIDFGTTNSLIAYSKDNNPQIINSVGKNGLLPSVIFYDDQLEKFLIGKNRGEKNSISSIKRLLSKSYEEIKSTEVLHKILSDFVLVDYTSSMPKVTFGTTKYSFPELAAKIFLFLKEHAEQELGTAISKAVVSVPAYFDDASRGAVMLAAKIAGFDVLRLIAEPTAAAYAYGFHKKSQGAYMIYDLGGGTFDVSILNMEAGVLQVIATGGDNLLGGDDLDHILAEHIAKELNISLEPALYLKAKELKELLSFQNSASLNFGNKKFKITREVFENLISPLINRTIKIAKDTLFDADVKLDGIILVGGSTRIPFIAQNLTRSFGIEVFSDIDPDRAVVIGAALQAENLSLASSRNSLLIDVLPLSVGMELYGGIAEKIIMRNTPIPFSITKTFTTYADHQTGMQFHIVQGEREMVQDCRSLARFELKNIPPRKAGMAKIEVTFAVDTDGILSVTAKENTSGIAQNIELKPSYGLSQTEINNMLENAFKNAEEDYKIRLLTETRIDAQNVITGITKAMNETPDILNINEKESIMALINSLQNIIYTNNRDEILTKIGELNKSAADFIEKHLNSGAKSLLEGKHISDI